MIPYNKDEETKDITFWNWGQDSDYIPEEDPLSDDYVREGYRSEDD